MQVLVEQSSSKFTDNDTIYQAAIEENKVALQKLLNEGGVIDELDASLLSPAGRLAKEGNIQAAEWLRKWFGANVNAILHGATRGGHTAYVEELRLLHGASYISWRHTDLYEASKKLDLIMEQLDQSAKAVGYQELLTDSEMIKLFEFVNKEYVQDIALFEECYFAAKELNMQKLRQLMPNGTEGYLLATDIASKLASEGLFEAAAQFNQTDFYQIEGAAMGNQWAYLDPLHQRILANPKDSYCRSIYTFIANGAGVGGHRQTIHHTSLLYQPNESLLFFHLPLLSRENYLLLCLQGLALNGHLNTFWTIKKEVEAINKGFVWVETFLNFIEKSGLFSNKTIALHTLTFIQSKHWQNLLASHCDNSNKQRIKRYKNGKVWDIDYPPNDIIPLRNYSLVKLLPKVQAITKFMTQYQLNYDQALAWIKPEIHTLFLQVALPTDCLALIAVFLTPIHFIEALELVTPLRFHTYKSCLIAELQSYSNTHGSGHSKRAKSLISACQPLTSKESLCQLLDTQKALISGNKNALFYKTGQKEHEKPPQKPISGKYLEILERHYAKL